MASMKRAVLVRYDSVRRRVRAVGAHGIELDAFADLFVTIDSVPVARRALREDRVLEVLGAEDFKVPSSVRELLDGVRIVCTPMAAAGRYVGRGAVRARARPAADGRRRAPAAVDARQGDRDGVGSPRGHRLR